MDLVVIIDHDEISGALIAEAAGKIGIARVFNQPLDWRSHVMGFGIVFSLPLVPVALAGACLHFVCEERFNENLLFDLVAHRARTLAHVPELAA
jgi:hypothetical protein